MVMGIFQVRNDRLLRACLGHIYAFLRFCEEMTI